MLEQKTQITNSPPGAASRGAVCLTVDAEDWFHTPAHPIGRDVKVWADIPSRFPYLVELTLALYDRLGAKGTFFILGWIARRYPEQVKAIAAAGQEIACHGMHHRPVNEMSESDFARDLADSKKLLEDLAGASVEGFRAPCWSFRGAPWAYGILSECGFEYSSSILPVPGRGGGSQRPEMRCGVWEFPALCWPKEGVKLPAGGTLALRILPIDYLANCRDECLDEGWPAVYWFHPWELDPEPQILPEISAPFKLLRYLALKRLPERLELLAGGRGSIPLREVAKGWRNRLC